MSHLNVLINIGLKAALILPRKSHWQFLIVIAALFRPAPVFGQVEAYPFSQFDSLVSAYSVKCCNEVVSITQSKGKYEAFLKIDQGKLMMIRLEESQVFGNLTGLTNCKEEMQTYCYFPSDRISYYQVMDSLSNFCITVSVNYNEEKEILEEIAIASGLLSSPSTFQWNWPDEIPVNFRLNASIISIISTSTELSGFSKELQLRVLKDEKLISALNELITHGMNMDDFLQLDGMIVVCKQGTISKILNNQATNQILDFSYFIR